MNNYMAQPDPGRQTALQQIAPEEVTLEVAGTVGMKKPRHPEGCAGLALLFSKRRRYEHQDQELDRNHDHTPGLNLALLFLLVY